MKVMNIYISGEIGTGNNTLSYLQNKINNANEPFSEIRVNIDSQGGDALEGIHMYDFLRTCKQNVITIITGKCYSIASIIALAGDKRQAQENSLIMIHHPFGTVTGTAEEVKNYAENLEEVENKIRNIYQNRCSIPQDKLNKCLKSEAFINISDAIAWGFVSEIIEPIKAIAKINVINKKAKDMDKEKKNSPSILSNLCNFFKRQGEIQNLIVLSADRQTQFYFPNIKDGNLPTVGSKATATNPDGEEFTPDGTYIMENGEKFIFKNGELTEIMKVEDMKSLENDISEVKSELKNLKAMVQNFIAKSKDTQDIVNNNSKNIEAIQNRVGNNAVINGETTKDITDNNGGSTSFMNYVK